MYKKGLSITVLSAVVVLLFSTTNSFADLQSQVAERLKPVGEICKVGEPCAVAVTISATDQQRSAESIYQTGCLACHQSGVGGAPKIGDTEQWSKRMEQGLELVYEHAIKGFNTMPAKGLCADCSDDEIKAVVDYMLEGSR